MARFTQQDLQAFSTCLLALYTPQPVLPFATQALRALSALIPAESSFYVTIDFHTPHASSAVMEPATLTFPGDNRDVVVTVIREHPIVQYWQPDGRRARPHARRVSAPTTLSPFDVVPDLLSTPRD